VPARVYAVANQKGGVGKTTTAVNLAACLAEAGERCLLVDLDPQANATSGLGRRANGVSTHDLLDGVPLSQLAKPTAFANLDLVPAKPELAAAAVQLSAIDGGERYLADALVAPATDPYAFVFLDCPPAFGALTVNALQRPTVSSSRSRRSTTRSRACRSCSARSTSSRPGSIRASPSPASC